MWLLKKKLGLTTCWLDMIAEQEHLSELVYDYVRERRAEKLGAR